MTCTEEIAQLSVTELRDGWARIYGTPPPPRAGRDLLALGLAWRAQAKTSGGLNRTDREALAELVAAQRSNKPLTSSTKRPKLTPGTTLLREWKGKHYEVKVLEEGFLYENKVWKSLSQIAREITGTRWNGPAFFGLRSATGDKP
jgi:DUF2924 family protein